MNSRTIEQLNSRTIEHLNAEVLEKGHQNLEVVKERIFDLEERLIEFAVAVVLFVEKLPTSRTAGHLGGQLLRSGTSPSLNYGEAKAAESRNDFLHKMKVCLKELRETYNCLRILHKAKIYRDEESIKYLITECNELISIFVRSINTATKRKS